MAENESIALAQRACGESGPRIETSARGARRIGSEDAESSRCGAEGHEALETSSKVNVENRVDKDSREEKRAGEGNEGDEADDDYLVLSEVHVACPSHHVSTVSTFAFRLPPAVAAAGWALRGEAENAEGWEGSEDAGRSGAAESTEGIAGEGEGRRDTEGAGVAVDSDGDLLVARRKRRRIGSGGGGTGGGGSDGAGGGQRGRIAQLPAAGVPRGMAVQAGAGPDENEDGEGSAHTTLSPLVRLQPPLFPPQVWRASLLLADVMVANHRLLGGATVLELGAGAGVALWACMVASDCFKLHPCCASAYVLSAPTALPHPPLPAREQGWRASRRHTSPPVSSSQVPPPLTSLSSLSPSCRRSFDSASAHPSSLTCPHTSLSHRLPCLCSLPCFPAPALPWPCASPDTGEGVLRNCAANAIDAAMAASAASAVTGSSWHPPSPVAAALVRRLDWRHGWPPPVVTERSALHQSATSSGYSSAPGRAAGAQAGMGGAVDEFNGIDPFGWTEEEVGDASNATVLLAADVIYSDDITRAFFGTLRSLLRCGPPKLLLLALEKRFNFSLSHLAPVANGYAVFRSHFAAQNGAPSCYSGGHCSSAQQAAQAGEASCRLAEQTGGGRGTRVDGWQTVVDGRQREGDGDREGEEEGEEEELLGWRMDVGQVPQHVVGWERGSDMELWVIGNQRSLPLVCEWIERGVGLSFCQGGEEEQCSPPEALQANP
ncbi:unnamed protein product [Closterium sp. NIES-65]|nr:unnamed protein product [Closterium sp. NIES-65]